MLLLTLWLTGKRSNGGAQFYRLFAEIFLRHPKITIQNMRFWGSKMIDYYVANTLYTQWALSVEQWTMNNDKTLNILLGI